MGLSSMCNSVKSLNWSVFHVDFRASPRLYGQGGVRGQSHRAPMTPAVSESWPRRTVLERTEAASQATPARAVIPLRMNGQQPP